MKAFSQILAISQNEFRAQWRRRGMLVLTLGMMALPVAGAFLLRSNLFIISTDWVTSGAMTPAEARRQIAQIIIPTIWAPLYVVLALILPILTADSVVRDRQAGSPSGWGELLDSLPLRKGTFLLGKLSGMYASVLASCLIAMLLTGIAWRLLLGPFDLVLYLQEWIFGAAALAVLNGNLSMLLAATQPTSSRAVAIGVLVAITSLILLTTAPILTQKIRLDLWDYLNIARPALFLYFFKASKGIGSVSFAAAVNGLDVMWTLLAGLLELTLCGLAVGFWLYRSKEGR
jgi:hypothetical protein